MKSSLKFLIIICTFLKQSEGLQLKCDFRLDSKECKINSLNVFEGDTEVTSISGNYGYRKSNKDVREIWIDRAVETQIIPTNICKFFENTERFDIYGAQINQVTRKVFANCTKVVKLCILFTSLATLPEDVFDDLQELKELFLYENKFVILPENLIAKNTKLTSFTARNNLLRIIDIQFSSKVESIDLRSNKCIDKRYPEDIFYLSAFTKEISDNCENPMKKTLAVKVKEIFDLQMSSIMKDNEIERLKTDKGNLETVKNNLTLNISQLSLENSKLRVENGERRIEIEAMKTKNTREIAATFDENVQLKLNLTVCKTNVDEMYEEIKSLNNTNVESSSKIKESQTAINELMSNLSLVDKGYLDLRNKFSMALMDNMKYNKSLEECEENFTSTSEHFNSKISALQNDFADIINVTFHVQNTKLHSRNCDNKIHFMYFIVLFFSFIAILVVAAFCVRRYLQRTLIKQMVNHEVNMSYLLTNE